jgi:glycosyltransferase involved in cell wall biosynthesis
MNIIAFENTPTTAMGGSERSYFDVLTGLRARGHKVTLFYTYHGNLVDKYEQAGVSTKQTNCPYMFRSGRRMRDFLQMIVGVFWLRPYRGEETMIYLNFSEALPVAAMLRFFFGYRIFCHLRIGYWGLSRQIIMAGRFAETIIVINNKFKSVFERVFSKPGRVTVVYNGIHIPSILPIVTPKPATSPIRILCLGRIAPEKGIIELVNVFYKILERGIPATLQITGDFVASHSGDYRKELNDAIGTGPGAGKIFISPPVDDPIQYIAGFDLFIFPSTWDEPFGRTLPEAILAGTPVLARNVGMVTEIMADNLHFVFDDDAELLQLVEVFSLKHLLFDFERARARIRREFNQERMVNQVEKVLRGEM